jgi:hypothetical protein
MILAEKFNLCSLFMFGVVSLEKSGLGDEEQLE